MLMTLAPLSTAQRTASGIWSWSLLPPGFSEPSQVDTARIWASGATPMMPSGLVFDGEGVGEGLALALGFLGGGGWCPRPASMVATNVPCSGLAPMLFCPSGVPAPETSCPPAIAPFRSGWSPSTPLSITATFTPAPLETSQAFVIPASLSQYCLSRQVSACAAGAVAMVAAATPPASTADSRAETVRRSRAVALVIQDPILGGAVPCQLSGSADAQGNSVKNIVLAGGGRNDLSPGEFAHLDENAAPDEGAGTDDIHPARVHVGQPGPLRTGHGEQVTGRLSDSPDGQFGAVDGGGQVLRQLQRMGGNGRHGTGNPDDGGAAFQGNVQSRLGHGGINI